MGIAYEWNINDDFSATLNRTHQEFRRFFSWPWQDETPRGSGGSDSDVNENSIQGALGHRDFTVAS